MRVQPSRPLFVNCGRYSRLTISRNNFGRRHLLHSACMTATISQLSDFASSTMKGNEIKAFHMFPVDSLDPQLLNYKKTKVVHFLRHAEGTHNVNKAYSNPINFDARLTAKGQIQCQQLSASIKDSFPALMESELIVTSPLTRCVQTALLSLEPIFKYQPTVPFVAHESLRETVNYCCDKRRTISEISGDFPTVDFSHIKHDHDETWDTYESRLGCHETYKVHRESAELYKVAERGREFFQWLSERPEKKIIVCSHSAFFRCVWNWGLDKEVPYQPKQSLDDRDIGTKNVPVVEYYGDVEFSKFHRRDYKNCELRSTLVAFPE